MRLPRLNWKPHWFIDYTGLKQEGSSRQGRKLTYKALELGGNDFLVTLVASAGFFTDSYVLFASNAILPMLGFVYWHDSTSTHHETAFNCATLAGTIFGMLLFGFLGDIYGRRKMYGLELIILIIGTVGVLMSSAGYVPINRLSGVKPEAVDWGTYGSMDIQSWLLVWRFVSGVGIGGDYPLSSVIVSEFSPTRKRSRMLATIFSMQALGYTAASVVSLIVVKVVASQNAPYDPNNPQASARAVDQIWRWVTGLGLIPALVAVVMRLMIPESPRYTLDVSDNPFKAFDETNRLRGSNLESEFIHQSNIEIVEQYGGAAVQKVEGDGDSSDTTPSDATNDSNAHLGPTIKRFFLTEGNWRTLFATAVNWFLLDFALFGLGLNSPQTISKIWYSTRASVQSNATWPTWDTDYSQPPLQPSIFSLLIHDSTHSILISSIPSLTASALLILIIPRIGSRKTLLWSTFLTAALLFVIIGATYPFTLDTTFAGVTLTFYSLVQFVLYLGPNPLTFILPAELFPTRFRASCHGISAASGKFGSVIVQLFLGYVRFGHASSQANPDSKWLGWVLLIFALPMLCGAALSWSKWLPDVQHKDGRSKTLEDLAGGRARDVSAGDEERSARDEETV